MGISHQTQPTTDPENPRSNDRWLAKKKNPNPNPHNQVLIEGYVEEEDEIEGSSKGVSRTVSLTDEDLEELKGCVDLGFGFNYEEIPELCSTLPALELCYSLSQRFVEEQNKSGEVLDGGSAANSAAENESCSSLSPIPNWKISSPGDHPEEVKARLKFWAQAVACTVKLCN